VVAALAARRRGWRGRLVIGHDHPIVLSHQENRRDNRHAARYLYPRADLVVAGSPEVARDAVTNCAVAAGRVIQVGNAIDVYQPGPPPPHRWFTAGGPPVFVTVARLVAYKRTELLIEALHDVGGDARLVIIGTGPARDSIQACIDRLAMGERVELLGYVDDPRRYMAHACGFLLASDEEGFSQVLIEAMSTRCPVVTTDAAGGGPRHVTDNGRYGILVPRNDRRRLAQAITTLLDPSRRAHWALQAQRRARAFSPHACARQLVDELVNRGFDQPTTATTRRS
jgi:glycosyltransferase involved in cell wall biosynthesis